MAEHITKAVNVTGEVSVWVIPKKQWVDGEYKYTGEWEYQLRTDRVYDRGAVKVKTTTIDVVCEGGIDLVHRAVKTLEEAIVEEKAEHYKKINDLQAQINSLLMLTYQPSEETL